MTLARTARKSSKGSIIMFGTVVAMIPGCSLKFECIENKSDGFGQASRDLGVLAI
jgi:hypothetical protein